MKNGDTFRRRRVRGQGNVTETSYIDNRLSKNEVNSDKPFLYILLAELDKARVGFIHNVINKAAGWWVG